MSHLKTQKTRHSRDTWPPSFDTRNHKRAQKFAVFCLPGGRKLAFNQNSKSCETVPQNASNWSVEPIKKRSGFIAAKLLQ